MGTQTTDLSISNEVYDPEVGAALYNRYLDEKLYAEEMGFDGLMLNEHHSTPFCMQGVTNIGASILARQTTRAKIVILGNILPIWDDPLWLAEQLAMIDMISHGRLVSGFVRGGWTGERVAQLAACVQPGAVRGGAQLRHQGVDGPGTVQMGGQALPLSVREPVGEAVPEAASAGMDTVHGQRGDGAVVGAAPLPAGAAGYEARSDEGPPSTCTTTRRRSLGMSRALSTCRICGRYTWTRPRRRRKRSGASICRECPTRS